MRRGTVNWSLVRWLCLGSVPSAFLGVMLLRLVGTDAAVQHGVQYALAVALLLAAAGLVVKAQRSRRRPDDASLPQRVPVRVRPLPTALLGAAGGLVVGLTSVGSGSLIIVVLLALYPALRANDLVGTDLVQAIPLVAAAALGHAFFGDLHLDIAAAILIGSVPGVLLGARTSSRAPAAMIRTALIVVLLASALKLFGLPNIFVAAAPLAACAVAVAVALRRRYARTARPATPTAPAREGTPAEHPHQRSGEKRSGESSPPSQGRGPVSVAG